MTRDVDDHATPRTVRMLCPGCDTDIDVPAADIAAAALADRDTQWRLRAQLVDLLAGDLGVDPGKASAGTVRSAVLQLVRDHTATRAGGD